MADTLTLRLETAERALATLQAILKEPFSAIVRDASIQRFEYTFEACWKLAKAFLVDQEGVSCDSPKSCFRAAASAGLITSAEAATCLRMADDRNRTTHTYLEAVADRIYRALPGHAAILDSLCKAIRSRLAPTNAV